MDKTVAGLIGAIGALAAASPAQAANAMPLNVETALHAASYADLLKPIPNALALMKADAAAKATLLPDAAEGDATVQDVQLQIILPGRHHHHHHHRYWRRRYNHHHHHHHHHRYYR
jgi:hypothetical protein